MDENIMAKSFRLPRWMVVSLKEEACAQNRDSSKQLRFILEDRYKLESKRKVSRK